MRPTVSSVFLVTLPSILIVGIWLVVVSLNLIGDVFTKLPRISLGIAPSSVIGLLDEVAAVAEYTLKRGLVGRGANGATVRCQKANKRFDVISIDGLNLGGNVITY